MCPPELRPVLDAIWTESAIDPRVLRVACRLGKRDAYRRVVALVGTPNTPSSLRKELLSILGEFGDSDCITPILAIVRDPHDHLLRAGGARDLGAFRPPADCRGGAC